MSKFKIGDRVEYIGDSLKDKGERGIVEGYTDFYGITAVKVLMDSGGIFVVAEENLKKTNETIVIYRSGNTVFALDKSTGKRASAKCNPKDKFSFKVGAELAFNRLMGKPEEPKDEIKVGDTVAVVDVGHTYSKMSNWFYDSNEFELKNHFVEERHPERGKKYVVRAIHPHKWAKDHAFYGDVYAIQDPDTTQVFLIGKKGIKKVMR